jgi:hypothetical protein
MTMQQEEQEILGYFLKEAREQLNTSEEEILKDINY